MKLALFAALSAAGLIGSAHATVHTFTFPLDPFPPSTAMGTAVVTLDDVTGAVTVTGTYAGLSAPITRVNLHGPTIQCASIGSILPLIHTGGFAGAISGGGTLPAPLVTDMLDGLTYVNVESAALPTEVRGQVLNGKWFCEDCDGVGFLCPCSNPPGDHARGCDNAQSTGGVRLFATVWSPGGGTATFKGTGFPPVGAPTAIVIRSPSKMLPPAVFGDGLLCLDPPVVRFGAASATGGMTTHAVSHGAGPGTFNYQLWYRNTPITFCDPAAAFNTSQGLELRW